MNAAAQSPPEPDGHLPAALQALEDAVHALCGPQSQLIEGKLLRIPSKYRQLFDATQGEQVNSGGGSGGKSRPPVWLDSLMLRMEIDQTVECWMPAFNGVPPTEGRLRWIQAAKYRPQDVRKLEQITAAVKAWATEIDALLDPEPVVYLREPDSTQPAACTNCGTRWIYRTDSAEERVRQPVLKVTKDGCRCQRCHASWEPGQLRMLAAALGYPLPAGVLE